MSINILNCNTYNNSIKSDYESSGHERSACFKPFAVPIGAFSPTFAGQSGETFNNKSLNMHKYELSLERGPSCYRII